MKAETADYLVKARECLAEARQVASLPLAQVAAREAYLAAYHAAEAYIFEYLGKTVKTQRGLRTTFSRLARNEPRIASEYLTFLARAYELKSISDYGVGATTRSISGADATAAIDTAAIDTAERFIETITQLLSGFAPPHGPLRSRDCNDVFWRLSKHNAAVSAVGNVVWVTALGGVRRSGIASRSGSLRGCRGPGLAGGARGQNARAPRPSPRRRDRVRSARIAPSCRETRGG